jgi:hypothetical protein
LQQAWPCTQVTAPHAPPPLDALVVGSPLDALLVRSPLDEAPVVNPPDEPTLVSSPLDDEKLWQHAAQADGEQ